MGLIFLLKNNTSMGTFQKGFFHTYIRREGVSRTDFYINSHLEFCNFDWMRHY